MPENTVRVYTQEKKKQRKTKNVKTGWVYNLLFATRARASACCNSHDTTNNKQKHTHITYTHTHTREGARETRKNTEEGLDRRGKSSNPGRQGGNQNNNLDGPAPSRKRKKKKTPSHPHPYASPYPPKGTDGSGSAKRPPMPRSTAAAELNAPCTQNKTENRLKRPVLLQNYFVSTSTTLGHRTSQRKKYHPLRHLHFPLHDPHVTNASPPPPPLPGP